MSNVDDKQSSSDQKSELISKQTQTSKKCMNHQTQQTLLISSPIRENPVQHPLNANNESHKTKQTVDIASPVEQSGYTPPLCTYSFINDSLILKKKININLKIDMFRKYDNP